VHVHARRVPGTEDADALLIEGTGTNTDTHLAPGGRHGGLRLGMRPGRSYTCSVDVTIDDRLTGNIAPSRLTIAPGCVVDGVTKWAYSSSLRAPNEPGTYRLSTTFRVPDDAAEAWVRLICGMGAAGGTVGWDRFQLTPTLIGIPYFDGDTPTDRWYEYSWSGNPNASESVRTMRDPAQSWPEAVNWIAGRDTPDPRVLAEILGEIEARAEQLLIDEATVISRFLDQARAGGHEDLSQAAALLIAESRKRAKTGSQPDSADAAKIRRKFTTQIAALAEGEPSPAVASLAGRRLSEQNAWAAAVVPLRKAAEATRGPLDSYRLAYALQRSGQRSGIADLVRSAAKVDTDAPFDAVEAVAIEAKFFGPRREVGAFVAEHLAEIRARADATEKLFVGGLGELPIFTYWGQGYGAAPPIVRACRRALEHHNPAGQLHFIDDASLPYYAEFPDSLMHGTQDRRALFSDALRLELLARYGGIWVDATCLTTAPLGASVSELLAGDFFAFNYVESRISSWFMAARPHSRVITMLRAALYTWFDKRQDVVDYYLLHHLFEMLYRLDPGFTEAWDSGIRRSSRPPHELQVIMYDKADFAELDRILGSTFIHKLTHKLNRYHREGFISSDSYLAAVTRSSQLAG
jgi:hypothetical protein